MNHENITQLVSIIQNMENEEGLILELNEENNKISSFVVTVAAAIFRDDHIRPSMYAEYWIPHYLDTDFYRLFRMQKLTFHKLVSILNENNILAKDYVGGNPVIPVEKQVLITLAYLSSQSTMFKIANDFNVAVSSVFNITRKCTLRLIDLQKKFIRWPTEEECEIISQHFEEKAHFPGVIGAIDATHIKVLCPVDQQDSYTDRTTNKSITVQAVCVPNKMFTNIFAGFPGSAHDARVLQNSVLFKQIYAKGKVHVFYKDKYHILGDSAYPLKDWLITPFRKIGNLPRNKLKFNKSLSATRCVIENAFGLLKGRWRRLIGPVHIKKIEFATDIAMACCILHNFCLSNGDEYCDPLLEIAEPVEAEICNNDNTASGELKRMQLLQAIL